MDAHRFIAEFGHIANAPAGVGRLRELVIQLAISGRLVERGFPETPVFESLTVASKQRQKYEVVLELHATRPHPPIGVSPYAIPAHWQWVRLEQLVLYIQRGKSPKYADGGNVRVVSQKCIQWAGFDVKQARFIADDSVAAYGQERFLRNGDVLWNSTGTGTVGRTALYESEHSEHCVADSHVTVIRLSAAIVPRYLWCVIASPWIQSRIHPTHPDSLVSGTTQQVELATSTARALPIPLPPVEEQSRIVAKVDELMALCDKLENQKLDRRRMQSRLRQSTLQAIAAATSPHELEVSWARTEATFGRLFSEPEDVGALRNLVLDLALRGLLVPQDPTEAPATDLQRDIELRKRELSKPKKRKSGNLPFGFREDDIPFGLPKGWQWIRLGEIAELINGDRSKNYPNKHEYVPAGVPWINTGHIEPNGTLTRHGMNFISREKFDSLNSGKVEPDDLVYCLRGATFGKTAFVTPYQEGAIASSLMIIRPFISNIRLYLYYYLISPLGRSQIFRFDNGTAQPNLSADSVGLFAFPLAPISEQQRITSKIQQLVRFCDELESHLRHTNALAGRLATSAVSMLTGIVEQQEDRPVKPPKTELNARLRLCTAPDVRVHAPLATLLARHNGEMSARDLWQRFGGEVDAFYAQLKTEVAHGWIQEPAVAEVREKTVEISGS